MLRELQLIGTISRIPQSSLWQLMYSSPSAPRAPTDEMDINHELIMPP